QPRAVADVGDRARARRQHPVRAGGPPLPAGRRDGEEQRRALRGRGADGARRGAAAGDGRGGAGNPEPGIAVMSEKVFSTLIVAEGGDVLQITLNNPARKNAIGPVMVNELLHALDDAMAA